IGVFQSITRMTPLHAAVPLRVLVGITGASRSTAAMVARVAEATCARAEDSRLSEIGALTDAGAAALRSGDLPALGAAMNRAHDVLAGLCVSTPQLDALCGAARVAGAHGSKLTGAGGGGAVIAIAPRDRESAVLTAWRHAGVDGFVATLAAPHEDRGA